MAEVQNHNLPEPFVKQMRSSLGEDLTSFIQELSAPPPISIRINSKKQKSFKEYIGKVKWNPDKGFYLNERPIFTLDPEFHAGAYYVQEASSMFLEYALSQIFLEESPIKALDLCAAPGGKTTLLADALPKESFLLSNEVIQNRYKILRENIIKWGNPNTHISSHDSKDFKSLKGFFDLVVVDAPCSGEGLFRKDENAKEEWSEKHVQFCSGRQKRILADAQNLVKPGGYIFYCTCTYNPFENDENVAWMCREFNLEIKPIRTPEDWGIKKTNSGLQFYPHKLKGEGFYFACLQKREDIEVKTKYSKNSKFFALQKLPKSQTENLRYWIKEPERFSFFLTAKNKIRAILKSQVADCQFIDSNLYKKEFGQEIGTFKGRDFVPAHSLAMSIIINSAIPSVSLDKENALRYLKKEAIEVPNTSLGWVLAKYEGQNLGWMKILKNRVNNYFPKEYRIRMKI